MFFMLKFQQMGLPNAFRFLTGHDSPDNNSGGDKRDKHMTEATKSPGGPKPPTLDLNIEANRLKTFENWHVTFIDKHQLALLGFYYYGPSDMVKCYFCGVEIGMWEEGDDVLTDHMRWSPSCNLIRRNETNNVPISEAVLNQTLPPAPEPDVERMHTVSEGAIETLSEDDIHMYQHQIYGQGGLEAVLRGTLNLSSSTRPTISRPEHPEFAVEAKRLESYEDWPKTMRQKPQQLSDAGFYYTGKGDRVCCFSCGGGLKDWEENDDPWEQHAMWYGKCEYLKLMKGADFIENMVKQREEICKRSSEGMASCSSQSSQESLKDVQSSSSNESKQQENSDKSDEEEEKKDSKLCKICYSNEYNTIFLPCGHVIACAKCASSVSKCPACRQPFENVMRVYFS
ncbi:CLUMA_CG009286, isoform A [Clunio marinus]|uniref:CLUMA_CG009286, isoform A n=1 Tax=Clunio marinus TaxID=568069 RepID=A0A1J1I6B1_9DIPT|nr:CLUMA_CG009286, isoform A [Clunio marinus]